MYLLRQTTKDEFVVTTYNFQVQNYRFNFETEQVPLSFGDNLTNELSQIGVHQYAVRFEPPTLRELGLCKVTDMSPASRRIPSNLLPNVLAEESYQLRQRMIPDGKKENTFTLVAEVSFLHQIHPPWTLDYISDTSDIEEVE